MTELPDERLDEHDPRIAALPDYLRDLLVSDPDPDSRSEDFWTALLGLIRARWTDGLLRALFMDREGWPGITAHLFSQKNPAWKLTQQIAKARRKVAQDETSKPEIAKRAEDVLDDMNEQHCAGSVGNKFRVAAWHPDALYPYQQVAEFYTKTDFENAFVNPRVVFPVYKKGKIVEIRSEPRGAWWLEQERRTEFGAIDFCPGEQVFFQRRVDGGRDLTVLNCFSGFSCEPEAGDCSLYLEHVYLNISGEDDKLYNHILDWMASGVQHPEDPGRSTLSLRGDPGSGKGVFALGYGGLFGRHFLHVTHRDHVTGKFNSHSAETCLLFVDEALFVGNRVDAQILKTLTTESTKIMERKGIDAVSVRNYARLILATNEPHPITVEHNDRRYVNVYVRTNPLWANLKDIAAADARRDYFVPLLEQMKSGGREALLDYLLKRDISKFNPEAIPETAERARQKELSAPPGDKLVMEFAMDGALPGALAKRPGIAYSHSRGGSEGMFDAMRLRGGVHLRNASDNDLANIVKGWGFINKRMRDGNAWVAPPLGELRARIEDRYPGLAGGWDPAIKEWGDVDDADERVDPPEPELGGKDVPF